MKTLIKLTQWKKARLALSAVTVTALCVFGVFLYDTADYRTAMGRAYGDEAAVRAIQRASVTSTWRVAPTH